MPHAYWNDWYFGWGWLLWFGFVFLLFSSVGNWGYTYRAHQKLIPPVREQDATDIHKYAGQCGRSLHRLARCLGWKIESESNRQALGPVVALSRGSFLLSCQKYRAGAASRR